MSKSILITGSTDGIGLETAKLLAAAGHRVLLHGRSEPKLQNAISRVSEAAQGAPVQGYIGDLSERAKVLALAEQFKQEHQSLDVLINNAGVFRASQPRTSGGHDIRFVVNTVAPYLLTRELLPVFGPASRVVNLSSAAQSPVSLAALNGGEQVSESAAYAQSKLALTMWSRYLGLTMKSGPTMIAVNPGSFLGSKMVKEAYGMQGGDLGKGARILVRAAIGEDFAEANAKYFDNDSGQFTLPHSDALDKNKMREVLVAIGRIADANIW